MKKDFGVFLSFIICIIICVIFFSSQTQAATCDQWVAKVVSVQGTVQVQKDGETNWQLVKLNDTYCPGDKIRVQELSRANIALVNHPVLRLDQNSTITLGGIKEEKTSVIDLLSGAAHFFSRVARNLEVRTATVNAGVEGTEFFIRVEEDKTLMTVFEGKVVASNKTGSLAITSGQSAVAEAGKAPVTRVVVRPRDAVQWALYYPPVIYYRSKGFQSYSETDWQTKVQKSIDLLNNGDITGAFKSIAEIPAESQEARFLTYRASLMLIVGRVDEAGADMNRALELDPNNSDSYALQSIIALAQNEKGQALDLAEKAVKADSSSVAALIARSYVQQANFDLEGALGSLQIAVKQDPENALAWARLSEIWQSLGNLDESLMTATRAVELSPGLSRTQTVLGFAYLTRVQMIEAQNSFNEAIVNDQADPLPRLGLGLSMIRMGDLENGRREIEIAMSLDPENSLIRSYLGKAYFEEKKTKLDASQYQYAKELDPKDPTPWFYDAIRKQTINRPVEALRDLQKAIDLNDNRAVYRSRLLLDADLAARSASLARIYSDLGFQELALVEGWKSVNTDPSNYSAHRFLADSYSVRPRHEIARVSELLQSQLLQPLNITPIQPRLGESNLYLISAGGPSGLSFNEYNALFNRDRVTLQISGRAAENRTYGEEIVIAGISKNLSFSVGQTHFETDGWRENADQNDNIINAFVQLQVSPTTSIQAEIRSRDSELGDLALRFFPDEYLPGLRIIDDTYSLRLGIHHEFSPGSDFIGSFILQDGDSRLHDTSNAPFALFTSQTYQDSYSVELQHLYRLKNINTIFGAGYFNINATDTIDQKLLIPIDPFLPPQPIEFQDVIGFDTDHLNLYLYSHVDVLENVSFTVGGSYDHVEGESEDVNGDQFNPKIGFAFTPYKGTTIRGAAFKTLKRTLITNQTLEPTQVSGFNQFYDDQNGAEAWRYGIAADQKLSQDIYGGIEYSTRDLKVPFIGFTGDVQEVDWEERLVHAYLYWTPHEWLALSVEYSYEKIEREELTLNVGDAKTHRLPLGVSFYHPSGLSARLKATFFDQKGNFEPLNAPPGEFESGKDDFWLFDVAVSYRLPKRKGFITAGATNLFDKSFMYFDTNPANPEIQPDRVLFVSMTLPFN